jgi:hypothetical protein
MTNKASGAVLPAGTLPIQARLSPGKHKITIKTADPVGSNPADGVYACCVYPDGWSKDHQVMPDNISGLFEKVVGQLRGRYGASEVKLASAPNAVKAGALFEVEV